jgi:hypothetical protein
MSQSGRNAGARAYQRHARNGLAVERHHEKQEFDSRMNKISGVI